MIDQYLADEIFFDRICRKNLFNISVEQLASLKNYIFHLLEWNQKLNLISRREENVVWEQHILQSISYLFTFNLIEPARILDLGTGGGLPGIPTAILHKHSHITLMDSINKKIKALDDIINNLRLQNVTTVCGRAEEIGTRDGYKNTFDYIIARAVAPVEKIVKWAVPLLQKVATQTFSLTKLNGEEKTTIPKGSIIMLKGGDLSQEINAAKMKLGLKNIAVFPLVVKGLEGSESLQKKIVIVQP